VCWQSLTHGRHSAHKIDSRSGQRGSQRGTVCQQQLPHAFTRASCRLCNRDSMGRLGRFNMFDGFSQSNAKYYISSMTCGIAPTSQCSACKPCSQGAHWT